MSWQEYIVYNQCEYEPENRSDSLGRMEPGLGSDFNEELREKASVRGTPPPPDAMGLEGEYDPLGLAKRVAKALDEKQNLSSIDSVTLIQKGNKIIFNGQVPNRQVLDAIVETAAKVDGTHAVDIDQVAVASPNS
jgi:hypothetical protein